MYHYDLIQQSQCYVQFGSVFFRIANTKPARCGLAKAFKFRNKHRDNDSNRFLARHNDRYIEKYQNSTTM